MDPVSLVTALADGATMSVRYRSGSGPDDALEAAVTEAYLSCKEVLLEVIREDAYLREHLLQLEELPDDPALRLSVAQRLSGHEALYRPEVVKAVATLRTHLARIDGVDRMLGVERQLPALGVAERSVVLGADPTSKRGRGAAADGAAPRLVFGEIPGELTAQVHREEFAAIKVSLSSEQRVVLCAGGRGVGKSSLAASFARNELRNSSGTGAVVWLSGESEPLLMAGLAQIAVRVGLAQVGEDSVRTAQRGRDYLSALGESPLVVIDNAESPRDLAQWFPGGGCRVLLTSNDRRFAEVASLVQIGDFTREQSIDYLIRRTQLRDARGAGLLAEALGDLPLALAQAAAVIVTQRLTFEKYLSRLNGSTLAGALHRVVGYPHLLNDAILMSVHAAQERRPEARSMIDCMALLDPNGVSRGLMRWLGSQVYPDVAEGDVDEALDVAATMSLVNLAQDGSAAVMHRVISRVIREDLIARGEFADLLVRLSEGLGGLTGSLRPRLAMAPGQEPPSPPATLHLPLPDAASCVPVQRRPTVVALDRTGASRLDPRQTLLAEITVHALHAVRLSSHVDHSPTVQASVAEAAHEVAQEVYAAGGNGLIIELSQQVLDLRQQALGEEHPAVLQSLKHLSDAHHVVGRYVDALELSERTLTLRERVLGLEHPDTLRSRHVLAVDYLVMGRYAEALQLHEQVLEVRTALLGEEHPDTLWTLQMVAVDYRCLGRHAEAMLLNARLLQARIQALGVEHWDTAWSQHSVAIDHRLAARFADALALDEWTFGVRRRLRGPEHPETLSSYNSLAVNCRLVGRYSEAQALDSWCLAVQERTLGSEHPETLWSRHGLALDYALQGRFSDAEALEEDTLKLRAQLLGVDHPDTQLTRMHLVAARNRTPVDLTKGAASVRAQGRLW